MANEMYPSKNVDCGLENFSHTIKKFKNLLFIEIMFLSFRIKNNNGIINNEYIMESIYQSVSKFEIY